MKLIITFFNELNFLGNRSCHYYYNTEICNIDNNIFDCFLQIKKDKKKCISLPGNNIELEKWPEENLYALLFHFIFSTVVEQFGLKGSVPIVNSLYILDYLKHIDITEDEIKKRLKYNIEYEKMPDFAPYFNQLITESVELFKDVKENLNNKIFNPISYSNYTDAPFVNSIKQYEYHTPYFKCTKNDCDIIETQPISFLDKITKNIPFSQKSTQLHIQYTANHNLAEITKTINVKDNLKHVLDNNYYALLVTKNHVVTITNCYEEEDDLILEIKDSHGLECSFDCLWVSDWCPLIQKNKIKLNNLLNKWDKLWHFVFFYPYEFIKQNNIKNQFNEDTSLRYPETQISNDEGIAIARVLMQNTTLDSLRIHSNIDDDVTKAIAGALKKNKILKTLNLSNNLIGDDGANAIATALEKNKTLTILTLGNNNIGDYGAITIANALEKNQNLKILALTVNKISDIGAKAIAKALKKNKTLTNLKLGNNNIGDDGATTIANTLLLNQNLEMIALNANNISDIGAKAIAEALKKNKTLAVKIYLEDNKNISNQIKIEIRKEPRIIFN